MTEKSEMPGKRNKEGDFFENIDYFMGIPGKSVEKIKAELGAIMNFLPVPTYAIDLEGRIILWNRGMEELTGTKAKEILGKGDHEYTLPFYGNRMPGLADLALQPDTEGLENHPLDIFWEDESTIVAENYWPNLAETGKHTRMTAAKLFDNEGNPIGAIELIRDITELKKTKEKLKNSELKYRTIVNQSFEMLFLHDIWGNIIEVNNAAVRQTGYTKEELLNMSVFDLDPEVKSRTDFDWKRIKEKDKPKTIETTHVRRNGSTYTAEVTLGKIIIDGTEYVLALARDITERKIYEKQLINQRQQVEALFKNSTDAIVQMDNQAKIIKVNKNFAELFGYYMDEVIGKDLNSVVFSNENLNEGIQKAILTNGVSMEREATRYKKNGEPVEVIIKGIPIIINDEVVGGYAIYYDITERKKAVEKIKYLSFHDSLTGLYNRAYLENEMKRLDVERQLPISIIMADLNGLKLVNDTYGHKMGDEMLTCAAGIISDSCRDEDILVRWGGDEFIVFLPQTDKEDARNICKRINNKCSNNYVKDVPISLALGTATKEKSDESLGEIMTRAEDDMYKQKLAESQSARSNVLNTLLKTLETKSYETEAHAQRMLMIAWRLGEELSLHESELNRLNLLITLHDIGKINIPEEVLTKKGPLTDEEWELMKKHPDIGYRIALSTDEFAHVAEEILSHHERWDGRGYPQGLKGEEIPFLARIAAITDAYEVMTNGRPYKEPMSKDEIISELRNCAGTQFDPYLVDVFVEILEREG